MAGLTGAGPPAFAAYPSKAIPDIFHHNAWTGAGKSCQALPGVSSLTFDTLGLDAELLRAVREQGYQTPTPVQRKAIPAILDGEDLLAAAQTGTGKTAGFTLPLLQRLMATPFARGRFRPVRALILVPTRELALQVGERRLQLRSGRPST